ncbi:glycoside hydrolase family 18 protein [Spongiactinospora sp. TRM90649]|uniref:chitinase n=1 Tax=Spongiactinospora sp. TRM90649 TaxID=3031114 RepID=UPI0023F691C7|nr:glycoside hydrolase family 18 protein [Spongiactinospora sp. TRM90649]MDF5752765.1 glycoside hydrolase family 18 protein [Spongiactinospora sp. TRM90649]
MRSSPSPRLARVVAPLAALVVGCGGLLALPTAAHAANIVTNPGFENGLAGWTCSSAAGAQAVSSPVHGGSAALQATPAGGDLARCQQNVSVKPNSSYTLSAWVRGGYVFLGASGTGTTDVSTWASSASSYSQLSRTFTTGASTTSVTIYVNSWYGQGAYQADDVVLDGPPGDGGPVDTEPPTVPGGLTVGGATASSLNLNWTASTDNSGSVARYEVSRDNGSGVSAGASTSYTASGLSASTSYGFRVRACDAAGNCSAYGSSVSGTTKEGGGNPGGQLPKRVLVGYLHASFANGSGYIRMRDVPSEWDVINLAFGEPTSVTSGDIRFRQCPVAECANVEPEADFIAGIREKQAAGKKVLISIGGQNGQVQLTSAAARDKFVASVSAIIDKYGLDGLDIDFEGHSLYLNRGDNDFRNPTTPVIVNLISALKTLKARYGAKFVLTMAPETFFVQLGYQFYGPGPNGTADQRAGSYLPVIHAMRDDLTLLHVQDYNSGPIVGLDNAYHTMGTHDFHVAMTDMLLAGFPVAGGATFPPLRQDQVAFGLPAAQYAGNGFTSVAEVQKAVDCLAKGTNCGTYKPRSGTNPGLRGLMTWSINWDRYNNFEFSRNHRRHLDSLP